jgi:hypothetical protein
MLFVRFSAVFLYLRTPAIGVMKDYFYGHNSKILLYSMIT